MVKEQLGNWGVVTVKNIELMDVRDSKDSDVIANIMAKKSSEIEMQSRTEVAQNLKKAKEAEILAKQEVDLKQEEANQQVGMKKAKVKQQVGLADEQAKQAVSEQAKITAEKNMEVLKVNEIKKAEIDRDANIIKAEQDKAVTVKNAEATKAKIELNAEADKKQIELKAEADLAKGLKEAQAIEAKGKAEAEAKKQMELAPVNAQIALAKEIGENQGYQDYLVRLEQIKALCEVGIEQAKNLGKADIKINAMSNDVPSGVSKITDVFSPQGGLNMAGMLESFTQSPLGSKVVEKFLGKKPTDATE
jgi:flotillin